MDSSGIEGRGSKTLSPEPVRQPSWLVWAAMKGFRLLLLTLFWTGLGMAAGLFGGIVVLMIAGIRHHQMPPMELAYRQGAVPAAVVAGSCAFVWNLVRTVQAAVRRIAGRAPVGK